MRYNQNEIGKRIKSERLALKLSQTEFLKQLNYAEQSTRQYVGKWEKGEVLPSLDIMFKMCELFDCELGYLLCQHDCKTNVATDVQKETGLSESAIRKLRNIYNVYPEIITETLSKMIEHEDFPKLLFGISNHVMTYNQKMKRIDEKYMEAVAQYMNCKSDETNDYMEISSKMLITSIVFQIISDLGNKNKRKCSKRKSKLFSHLY